VLEMGREKRERMKLERENNYNLWWNSLTVNEQSEIIEGYNTLLMRVPMACPTLDAFKRRCYKISNNLDNRKTAKAFKAAGKAGNILLGKENNDEPLDK
jgi:hypothetical protein